MSALGYIYDYFNLFKCQDELRSQTTRAIQLLGNAEQTAQDLVNKYVSFKNPIGLIIQQARAIDNLKKLLPDYIVDLFNGKPFSTDDQFIIKNTLHLSKIINDSHNLDELVDICISLPDTGNNYLFDVFEFGKQKYSDWDFLSLDPNLLLYAFTRHLYKHFYKGKFDEESRLPHIAHAKSNLIMIEHIIRRK